VSIRDLAGATPFNPKAQSIEIELVTNSKKIDEFISSQTSLLETTAVFIINNNDNYQTP